MKQWQYHLIPVLETTVESLNRMGKAGWRLVPGTTVHLDSVDYLVMEHDLLEAHR